MFVPKPSSIPQSRHSRRDAAVDRQSMELPITLPADHPLQLGNFTSAHLGTFESALTCCSNASEKWPNTLGGPTRTCPIRHTVWDTCACATAGHAASVSHLDKKAVFRES